jgi:hypothetical protein
LGYRAILRPVWAVHQDPASKTKIGQVWWLKLISRRQRLGGLQFKASPGKNFTSWAGLNGRCPDTQGSTSRKIANQVRLGNKARPYISPGQPRE